MAAEYEPTRELRPHLDARTTAWLIGQRERVHALELEAARLKGQLDASERVERSAQRYADKLEEKLSAAHKREATLARALGYVEAQRDTLNARLGQGGDVAPGELEERHVSPQPRARPSPPTARPVRRP